MATINLRDYFFCYKLDCFVEVPDEDVEAFLAGLTIKLADVYFKTQREENAYKRQQYRHKAHYSLDCNDGIQNDEIGVTDDPVFGECVANLTKEQLYYAIGKLPEKQAKRIYAHYYFGFSYTEIAKAEGVDESAVRRSIERGLLQAKKLF